MRDTWNVLSLGPDSGGLSPARQPMVSGLYSCSGDAACWADDPGCRSAGRPERSQESATDVVANVPLTTGVLDTWNIPSLGSCPGRQSMGGGRDSYSEDAVAWRMASAACRPEWS